MYFYDCRYRFQCYDSPCMNLNTVRVYVFNGDRLINLRKGGMDAVFRQHSLSCIQASKVCSQYVLNLTVTIEKTKDIYAIYLKMFKSSVK